MPNPYIPAWLPLPLESFNFETLLGKVTRATRQLARYDGLLTGIPDPHILLAPLTTQEAVLSSKIEGTQASMVDVLEYEAGKRKSKGTEQDIQEIGNYRMALLDAEDWVSQRGITLGLVQQLHSVLMESVRGEHMQPGEFRRIQNWIGRPGSTIETATFVPPDPMLLVDRLRNWEQYLLSEDFDPLIQAAIIHAQFEVLHPFLDGNGRVGRLLIPLFLYHKRCLSRPVFYLSEYLEEHREEYYSSLRGVSESNDWMGWIMYFLDAVNEQAIKGCERVMKIKTLFDQTLKDVAKITNSSSAISLVNGLFRSPLITVNQLLEVLDIKRAMINRHLTALVNAGILNIKESGVGSQATLYEFKALLDIVVSPPK